MLLSRRNLIKIAQITGATSYFKWRGRKQPKIIMYHRVMDADGVFALPEKQFRKQMEYLSSHYKVISLGELLVRFEAGELNAKHVALTFDDGHFDFYGNAWRILREYKLPATLYITTGFIDGKCWLWPDLLKYTLSETKENLVDFAPLGVIQIESAQNKAWKKIANYLLAFDSAERNRKLEALAASLNVEFPEVPLPPFHALSWEQIKEMQDQGLDIGSHTVTHPILSAEPAGNLKYELVSSFNRIKEKTGVGPLGLCYPNGMLEDVNDEVIRQAKQHYSYGLMACNDTFSDSLFMLGRIPAPNSLDEFKWRLVKG
jgi:peptidoglycan/xylan/chitin deacetylase (PgdA/CDA1 family)